MTLPHDRALHPTTDRRDEFVGVVAAVLPRTSQALEGAAMYTLMALLWGLVAYLALNVIAF